MRASATLTTVPSIITMPEPSTVVASTQRPAAVPMRSCPASAMRRTLGGRGRQWRAR